MDSSDATVSSAEAFVNSLAAVFNVQSMGASSVAFPVQPLQAPVCLPLPTPVLEGDLLQPNPPAATGLVRRPPAKTNSRMQLIPGVAGLPGLPVVPTVQSVQAAALLQNAGLAPAAAAGAVPALPAAVPVGAETPISPTAAAVPPASTSAQGAALDQAAMTAATVAGLNTQLLAAGGLSAGTVMMPTGATAAQIAGGMPAMQAIPVLLPTQQAAGSACAPSISTASDLSQHFAGLLSPVSTASTVVPSYASEMSMATLKSASVASSMISTPPSMADAGIAAAAATATAATPHVQKKVRVLLSSGGEYEELPPTGSEPSGTRAGHWRYIGGETRLVGLMPTTSFSHFLQQLSKATAAVWDEGCRLMYDLPGADGDGGTLVDLIDDEDLEMMWEELEVVMAVKPGFKLHIYAQLSSKRGSAGGSSSTCASADSHVTKTQDSNAVGGSHGGHNSLVGSIELKVHPAHAAAPAGTATPSGCSPVVSFTGAAGDAGGSAGASTANTLNSSEYDDILGGVVSETPYMNLADLEAKLEIIRPEDLQAVRLLGTGGFGEVYLCRWHSCDVAVKCLNPNLLVPDGAMGSISKDNVSELLKEASILGNVRHPNIVWVYGLVMPALDPALEEMRSHLAPGQGIDAVKIATQLANRYRQGFGSSQIRPPALVTEYLASGSLRAAITRRADFLSRDSVRIKLALDAARGMDYLHAKHIVHFDLKTANLLVGMRDKTPVCKVADFGLSKQKQQTFVTGVASLRGTLPWIAPEIIKTPGTVTEAVDVYSFGIVLWELWTLREPFEGINYHALLHMMSSSQEAVRPPMPGSSEFEGDAGSEPATGWAQLITDCWATDAGKRPTFRQVVARLENMLRANRMAKRRTVSGPAASPGC